MKTEVSVDGRELMRNIFYVDLELPVAKLPTPDKNELRRP